MKCLMRNALWVLLSCFLVGQGARAMQQQGNQQKSYNLVDLYATGISYSRGPGQKLKYRYFENGGESYRFCECCLREREGFVGKAALDRLLAVRSVSETKPESKSVNPPDKKPESQSVDNPVQPSIGQRLLPWAQSLWPVSIFAPLLILRIIQNNGVNKDFMGRRLSLLESLTLLLTPGQSQKGIFVTFVVATLLACTVHVDPLIFWGIESGVWLRGKFPVLVDQYPTYPEVCECQSAAIKKKMKLLGYPEADVMKIKYIPGIHPDASRRANNALAYDSVESPPIIALGPSYRKHTYRNPLNASLLPVAWHEAGHLWHQARKKKMIFKFLLLASDLLVRGVLMWFGRSTNMPQKFQWLAPFLAVLGVRFPENNREALCLLGGACVSGVLELCNPEANFFNPLTIVAGNAYARYHERLADDFALQYTPSARGLLKFVQELFEVDAEYDKAENTWYGRAWHCFSYYLFATHPTASARAEVFREAYRKRLLCEKREKFLTLVFNRPIRK